jgi:uncharacterized protein YndB with AHSA1/START domain
MSKELMVKSTVSIEAPAAKVWDALVNPEMTKKYMFGCAALSDWKPGSPLIWKGVFDGIEIVAVKGNIVEIKPGKYLAYTTIDPNSKTVADIPENYLTATYELTEEGGHTVLTATQGDFGKVAEGDKRYKEAVDGGGWEPILLEIKKLVEAQ